MPRPSSGSRAGWTRSRARKNPSGARSLFHVVPGEVNAIGRAALPLGATNRRGLRPKDQRGDAEIFVNRSSATPRLRVHLFVLVAAEGLEDAEQVGLVLEPDPRRVVH